MKREGLKIISHDADKFVWLAAKGFCNFCCTRVLRDQPPKLEAEQTHEQQGHLQAIFNYVGHLPLVHSHRWLDTVQRLWDLMVVTALSK